MFLRKLKVFLLRLLGFKIKLSILIPFSSTDPIRKRNFEWLVRYWLHELPYAEILIGTSSSPIFCKGEALNNAASRSHGKVLAILDADAYLRGSVLMGCVNNILEAQQNNTNLWYVPYRNLYRLSPKTTFDIVASDPKAPLRLPTPPDPSMLLNNGGTIQYGHKYGAMLMIFPRTAYNIIGGFDERFKGWGGEDIALVKALDTLFSHYKTTSNDILHLWHPFYGSDYKTRVWEGQEKGQANSKFANEYFNAASQPSKMKKVIEASKAYRKNK